MEVLKQNCNHPFLVKDKGFFSLQKVQLSNETGRTVLIFNFEIPVENELWSLSKDSLQKSAVLMISKSTVLMLVLKITGVVKIFYKKLDYKKYFSKEYKNTRNRKKVFSTSVKYIIAVVGTGSEIIQKDVYDSAIKFVNVSSKSPAIYTYFERSSFAKNKNVLDEMVPGGLTYN